MISVYSYNLVGVDISDDPEGIPVMQEYVVIVLFDPIPFLSIV
jgi:hypothetical protein